MTCADPGGRQPPGDRRAISADPRLDPGTTVWASTDAGFGVLLLTLWIGGDGVLCLSWGTWLAWHPAGHDRQQFGYGSLVLTWPPGLPPAHADQDLPRCPGDGTPVGIGWARIGRESVDSASGAASLMLT